MYVVSALILFGVLACEATNDMCLNKTEYDFYIIGNLVKDFENRIQSLKKNVKEVVKAKCPNASCPDIACTDDWVSYNGNCYFFENTRTYNFDEARAFCKQKKSVMLYVTDEAENSFILRWVRRFKPSYWYNGLSDQRSEGNWKWSDTKFSATFIKWSPGQPEGGTKQNCVCYVSNDSYQWHDAPCTSKYSVICKREI